MMKLCYFAYPLLPIILAAVCPAESLVLRSGVTVSGKLLAMDQRLVRIERCGREEQYAREDVKTIGLDGESSAGALCDGSESAKSELASATDLPLRLLDYLDSEHEPAGQVFRAEFDAPLKVEGRVILPLKTAVLLRMVDLGGEAGRSKRALCLF